MDIHGGKSIMTGPKNYVADPYSSIPILITVEGANIMTRNLMIFGQGATRSHPYVLKEMLLAKHDLVDGKVTDETVSEFDRTFFGHIGFSISNAARSFMLGIAGGLLSSNPGHSRLKKHYRDMDRLSAAFALIADVSMLSLQSKINFKEMLSARLGDLLSYLYLASMVLKHYESEGCPEDEYPLVKWSMEHLTYSYQVAIEEILQNYPSTLVAIKLSWLIFPLGKPYSPPEDQLDTDIANAFTSNSELRQRYLANVFDENIDVNPAGQANHVFLQHDTLKPLFKKIIDGIRAGKVSKAIGAKQIELAKTAGVISAAEAKKLLAYDRQLMEIIHVDHFDEKELVRKPLAEKKAPAPKKKAVVKKAPVKKPPITEK
jgi:acyl-CoA dehydrogenase